MIGLSFKEGTDDLRESPLVEVVEHLLGKGYDLRIYDRNVRLASLFGANKDYILNHIPHLARLRACFALWQASAKRPYLDEAERLLLDLRDGAPPAWRKAVLEQVPVHAEILAAARQ